MRTKLTITEPQAALDRLLDALANELIEVSDDEILGAAKELGMNPMMKGSAAFLGLRVAPVADLAEWTEFFEAPAESKHKARRARRLPSIERKQ
jgi:hypothetical protein